MKDLMSMAQECSFSTDIHPLVNTVASQPPGVVTEEELLAINPRYGDVVHNMISLRENYREYILLLYSIIGDSAILHSVLCAHRTACI